MNLVRGNFIYTILIFVILVMAEAVLIPLPGNAQEVIRGEFRLPHDVRWENSVLPAGSYVYYVDSGRWPVVVRVEETRGGFTGVLVAEGLLKPGNPEERGGIFLGGHGDTSYIVSLRPKGMLGDLFFSAPAADVEGATANQAMNQTANDVLNPTEHPSAIPGNQPVDPDGLGPENTKSAVRARGYLKILNPDHQKISLDEAEKVYLSVCEAIEREFHRTTPVRPPLVVRLGASDNVLQYPVGEIRLKKWDQYRFADAVVDLAMHYMLPPSERTRLSNAAVREADTTVDVCELKACVN